MGQFHLSIDGDTILPDLYYELNIRRIGQEHCNPKKKEEIKHCFFHSLHFVINGKGILSVCGKKYHLSRGSVFLLYEGDDYQYSPDPLDPWSYIWVDFSGTHLETLFNACGFNKEKPYVILHDFSSVVDTLRHMIEAYDASQLEQLTCSAYFLLLIDHLIENRYGAAVRGVRYSAGFKRFRNILIYVNNNYRMNLSVGQIAEDNYLSERRLSMLFAEFVGMTPINYLNKYRISMACELLKTTQARVFEIAESVGFSDEKYFMRLFKQIKGVSTTEYRNHPEEDPFSWLRLKGLDPR